ncbi:MAG: hypothetical protein A2Y33_15245 [Spirochaetes bacterium GWF1_51_8]|nr:MAG: hypothetical protein A2Y33_15245 [Spirochaetes bacterium GWF1_51_8]
MKLKIANFNVCNLALPGKKIYGRIVEENLFNKKKEWIGERLALMNADIIGFQEVFDRDALVQTAVQSGAYNNPNIAVCEVGGTVPLTGLLSRFPMSDVRTITAFPEKAVLTFPRGKEFPIRHFHHPVLRATVSLPAGIDVTVIVVHLKSKRPYFDGMNTASPASERDYANGKARALVIRAAESFALRSLVIDEIEGNSKPLMLFGDLNDFRDSVTTGIITGDSPMEKFAPEVKKASWDQLLYSTYDIQLRRSNHDVYYTHIYNGSYETLDHILVSQEFVHSNPAHIGRVEYMRIFNDHILDRTLTNEDIPEWQSDHGQVLVSLILKDPGQK